MTVTGRSSPASERRSGWQLVGILVGALVASVCCLGPLVLVLLGATGAWIGGLAGLEPLRPLLMAATAGLLGLAFYREYRRPAAEACEPGAACAVPAARRGARVALWVVALAAVTLLALPYATPRIVAASAATTGESESATVSLAVHGMTCDGCVAAVTAALQALPGVGHARVTFEPPRALVTYDPSRIGPERLVAATAAVGYPADVMASPEGRE